MMFFVCRAVIGRAAVRVAGAIEDGKPIPMWHRSADGKSEDPILYIARNVLSDREIEFSVAKDFHGFQTMLQLIKQKLLNECGWDHPISLRRDQCTDADEPSRRAIRKVGTPVRPPQEAVRSDREVRELSAGGERRLQPFGLQATPAPRISGGGIAIFGGDFLAGTGLWLGR